VSLTCLAIAFSIVVSAAPASPASAPSQGGGKPSDERSKIEVYLAAHDVASAEDLQQLATAPEKVLMAVASDAHVEGLVRARAVAALHFVGSHEAQAFLSKLIQSKAKATNATDRLILRRAAMVLGWMAGAGAAEDLAQLFDNDDADVRLDAAIGIGLTRAETAATLLRRQLTAESAPRVRAQIERQLHALDQVLLPEPEKEPSHAPKRQPMRGGW
jgi:HEAT repeat protein